MKKKTAAGIMAVSALVATGAVKYKRLEKMDMIERCSMCSEKFVSTIAKLHKGLPAPPLDEDDVKDSEEVFLSHQRRLCGN